jgi:carbon monoxide dehydrogenase subunit G
LNFTGSYELKASRETVFDFVTDPQKIGRCFPDVKSLEMEAEDKFVAVVRVGLGLIKGDFKFRVTVVEKRPPSRVRLKATGTGTGSSVDLDTVIELAEITSGTRLSYIADVKIGGPMAGLAQRVLKSASEKTVNDVFDQARRELEKQ